MKTFKCKCGKDILLDDEDFDRVKALTWNCYKGEAIKHVRSHRVKPKSYNIGAYTLGVICLPGFVIDHIDRNPHNNQKSNLRIASYRENAINHGRQPARSGYIGVYPAGNKGPYPWAAQITFKGKRKCLGVFKTKEDAALAFNKASLELNGSFARLNLL